ncbi:MAG: 6,7-dimethyl-8-ribityllumazine synthase [Burkholderiales bacterium]|nr:6,7-dimethyl-8-ribityllumazine synthase [Pseudomonadota bacterium]MCC7068423.1 6,7-dimethyl-8-ribityllumazine synthase [Burkholderiales bacterium]
MSLQPLMKLRGAGLRIGIVTARFNAEIGEQLLAGARKALAEMGVEARDVAELTVPGALEIPLALQALAATEAFDALIALGCVIKGDTYHFEVVSNESASGISRVGLEFDVAIGNGVLTTLTEAQANERAAQKGFEAAQAAVEMALLQEWAHAQFGES